MYNFEQNFSKWLLIYQRLLLEMHKQINQTSKSCLIAALTSKLELKGFLSIVEVLVTMSN